MVHSTRLNRIRQPVSQFRRSKVRKGSLRSKEEGMAPMAPSHLQAHYIALETGRNPVTSDTGSQLALLCIMSIGRLSLSC